MKLNLSYSLALVSYTVITSCSSKTPTQIAENTFIQDNKIYKVIDNEVREIADLNADNIKKFEVSKPKQRDLGVSTLSFVKQGAETSLKALYRGNYLYYSLKITGINDLRENYSDGRFSIEFVDEFGFILHSTEVSTGELTRIMDSNGSVQYFEYNGKTEMSTEINSAIKTYNMTASLRKRTAYGY